MYFCIATFINDVGETIKEGRNEAIDWEMNVVLPF